MAQNTRNQAATALLVYLHPRVSCCYIRLSSAPVHPAVWAAYQHTSSKELAGAADVHDVICLMFHMHVHSTSSDSAIAHLEFLTKAVGPCGTRVSDH